MAELMYGFMRFEAHLQSNLVGFNRRNPQPQERVIAMESGRVWIR